MILIYRLWTFFVAPGKTRGKIIYNLKEDLACANTRKILNKILLDLSAHAQEVFASPTHCLLKSADGELSGFILVQCHKVFLAKNEITTVDE
jgi:hypothetical protein